MKRLFWTIVFLVSATIITTLFGCKERESQRKVETFNVEDMDISYSIYVIDSCEYIIVHNGNATWGSHKGNCKNSKHVH